MAQNIYDRPDFFEAYTTHIDRSNKETKLDADPAWKRLHPLLPSVRGEDVLDLGCGSGWFCRWAANQGAKSVLGIDLSDKMLARARDLSGDKYPCIEYRRADLDELQLPDGDRYGLVFSALTLHYLRDLPRLLALVHRALQPGATFVFNVEHPIYTAPLVPGETTDATGEPCWNLNNYHRDGERVVDWLTKGLRKQHRSLTTYMRELLVAGFEVTGMQEFLPTQDELDAGTVDGVEALRPLFLMMSVRKKSVP